MNMTLSQADLKFRRLARENGGLYVHDFSQPDELEYIAEMFGGLAKIKAQAPNLYQTLTDVANNGVSGDESGYGVAVSLLDPDQPHKFRTESFAYSRKIVPSILLQVKIIDVDSKKEIGRQTLAKSNTSELSVDIDDIQTVENLGVYQLENASKVSFVDSQGNPHFVTMDRVLEGYANSNDIVASIDVEDPRQHPDLDQDMTTVFYAPRTGKSDYNYKVEWDANHVPVMLPYNGTATLQNGWHLVNFDDVNTSDNAVFQGWMYFQYGGSTVYDNDDGIDFSTNSDWTKLSWHVQPDWHNDIVFNGQTTNTMIADVRGTIAFRVAHKDFIQQPMIHIRLSSDPKTITAGETKRINQVSYMWGCFAAGTLIKMADNTLKPIEAITDNDQVWTKNGGVQSVIQRTSGTDDLIYHLKLAGYEEVLLTQAHPILYQDGPIAIENIRPGDSVMTEDGLVPVEYCYQSDYSGPVYNIANGSADWLSAQGVLCGNQEMQNTPIINQRAEPVEATYSPKALQIQREIELLMGTNT